MRSEKSRYDRDYRRSKLYERILRRFYIKLAIYLVWVVLCGAAIFSKAGEYIHSAKDINPGFVLFIFVVLILPLFLLKLQRVFEHTWDGIIVNIYDKIEYPATQRGGRIKLRLCFDVQCTDGAIETISFINDGYSIAHAHYKTGDHIVRFPGTNYPLNLSRNPRLLPLCPQCGHGCEDRICPRCGAELIQLPLDKKNDK